MKLEVVGAQLAIVRLSRRNLLSLLTKLDWPESARTLAKVDDEGGPVLICIAEEDGLHYGQRSYPPGSMHPRTERDLIR